MDIKYNVEKTEERIKNLNKLYDEYYCGKNGICKYYSECSSGMCENGYSSSRCTKVGKLYDLNIDGKDVRIVFVGKEGPNFQKKIERPAKLSESLDKKGAVTQHWLTSYKMLSDMLGAEKYKYVDGTYKNQPCVCLQTFTLTNEFRCAFKKQAEQRSGIINNDIQRNNCRKLLKRELEILEPTIVILQLEELKTKVIFPEAKVESETNGRIFSIFIGETKCFFVETKHPSFKIKGKGNWNTIEGPIFKSCIEFLHKNCVLPNDYFDVCNYLNLNCEKDVY